MNRRKQLGVCARSHSWHNPLRGMSSIPLAEWVYHPSMSLCKSPVKCCQPSTTTGNHNLSYQALYPRCNHHVKVTYTPIGDARCCTPCLIMAPAPTLPDLPL